MSGKAIGIGMTIGVEGDLQLPTIPHLTPVNPTTEALKLVAEELVKVCEKVNSLLAKLRKGGYLEFF